MSRQQHWEQVYSERSPLEVSWYQREPELSLAIIEESGIDHRAPIIDVGGGGSTLVDHLLGRGYGDITVLDLSQKALDATAERLGGGAAGVRWIQSDIAAFEPPRQYAFWHDRAVFHFLIDPADRAHYRAAAEAALAPGAFMLIATFAPDGPEKCSGLPVARYDAPSLVTELGDGFQRIESHHETHRTPGGAEQAFGFHLFRRV